MGRYEILWAWHVSRPFATHVLSRNHNAVEKHVGAAPREKSRRPHSRCPPRAAPSHHGVVPPLVFRRALFFFTGLACGGVAGWLWLGGEKSAPAASPAAAQFRAPRPAAQDFSAPQKTAPGRIAIESAAAPAASPEAAAAHEEFQRLLAETLHAPDEERTARLALLLARLRRLGPAGAEEILAFLRTGREIPRSEIYSASLAKNSGSTFPNFREVLLSVLAEITVADPALSARVANETLHSARSIGETMAALKTGGSAVPETIRTEAAVAISRLLTASDETSALLNAAQVMAQFQADELLPILAAKVEKEPYEADAFLDALWRFPTAMQNEYARHLLESERMRETMRMNPHFYARLDLREPDFCAAILADFPHIKSDEQRMYLIRDLGEDSAAQRFVARSPETPRTEGEPGTQSQAVARLALLDSLAPFCDTPLLRLHLAESRAKLAKMLAAP